MKKLIMLFAACAMLMSCGKCCQKGSEECCGDSCCAEKQECCEKQCCAEKQECCAEKQECCNEKATLIDQYVAACEAENEIEATRVAKRIDAEYKEQLTSADVERMAKASAVLAEKRAGQAQEAAGQAKDAVEALKGLKK